MRRTGTGSTLLTCDQRSLGRSQSVFTFALALSLNGEGISFSRYPPPALPVLDERHGLSDAHAPDGA